MLLWIRSSNLCISIFMMSVRRIYILPNVSRLQPIISSLLLLSVFRCTHRARPSWASLAFRDVMLSRKKKCIGMFSLVAAHKSALFLANVTWIRNHTLSQAYRQNLDFTVSSPPLTFFQSPFDRAWFLANSVQVSIQGGHKEQAFRKRNCAGAAKPLEKHKAKKRTKSGRCTVKTHWLITETSV